MEKKRWLLVAVVLGSAALALTGLGAESAAAQSNLEDNFVAMLRGGAEVPPVMTDTQGRAFVEFEAAFSRAKFELNVAKGRRVTQSHIHCAPRGVNGPIILFLAGFHENGWDLQGVPLGL